MLIKYMRRYYTDKYRTTAGQRKKLKIKAKLFVRDAAHSLKRQTMKINHILSEILRLKLHSNSALAPRTGDPL